MDSTRDSRASISSCKLLWKRQNKQKSTSSVQTEPGLSAAQNSRGASFPTYSQVWLQDLLLESFGVTQILNPASLQPVGAPRMPRSPQASAQHTDSPVQQLQTNLCLLQHLLGLLQGMTDEDIPNLVGDQLGISIIQQHDVITGILQVLQLFLFARTQKKNFCKNSKSFVKHFSGHTAG